MESSSDFGREELLNKERLAVLGQLTATVSHELRNPLGVIRSSTFYLIRRLKQADDVTTKHLIRIDDQVGICDAIVGDLLEYTRGRYSEKSTGNIGAWLQTLVESFGENQAVKIAHRPAPEAMQISFDPEKMRRVVVNLITNAVQAVVAKTEVAEPADPGYEPLVTISTSRKADNVTIRIEDNGIGMDPETVKRAFEPLYTTRARGTGLGLAIVEKIVEEHGGTVALESRPREGTAVTIELPQ